MSLKSHIRSDIPISEQAINAIIRPPRKVYDNAAIPMTLKVDNSETFIRYPVTFRNNRNQNIVGSIYHSSNHSPMNGGPCVIYLHGNASSQLEGQFLVPNICKYGIFVFCFDFCGCGNSDGKYISLGYFEKQDTEFLINVLHKMFNMGPFIVWGRSMGAATALLVQSPYVAGRISDSSFTSVHDMCSAIAQSMNFPSIFVPTVIWYLKKKVLSAANFNFEKVEPISIDNSNVPNLMPNGEVPAVFGHAEHDQFIPYSQCTRLFQHYASKSKFIMNLEGGHNSRRDDDWIRLGVSFILDQLHIKVPKIEICACRNPQDATVFHFSDFKDMVEMSVPNKGDLPTGEIIHEYIQAKDSTQKEPAKEEEENLEEVYNNDDSENHNDNMVLYYNGSNK
ncbi:hypothetical protein M9Y10_022205 [Tritrichomonas musculus]|uniref:Serine aminopeptidase S33 domain-containing protein n=1 Tax=Tritrichomonas musculus TaxID=1915356 RepID=A0ABR2KSJ6_9EUKA